MSNTLSFLIQINDNFDRVNSSFNNFQSNVHSGIDKVQKQLNGLRLNNLIQNISSAADGLTSLNDPGLKLSSSLADLSAITGETGSKLKEIEGYARENAKTFGGSAADGVEAYKLILSQLSPEISKQPKALQAMGNAVSTLSKTMGGDTVAATEVLTTAMNQYQVSLDDPIRASTDMAAMMNIMAAAAKEGSAELPQIKSALEQSGLAAKTANVSFAETNAAIQVLDKSGKKGAEGGVALRNVMTTLSEGRFLPKEVKKELSDAGININALGDRSKSLKERLTPLKKIMEDQALVTKLFGKENTAAAISLISGIDEMGRLTGVIQNTKTAYEQAAVVMESPMEKNKRLQAQIDDFKISLFNSTDGWLGYATVLGNTTRDFSNLMPVFSGAGKVFSILTSATKLQALWTGIVSGATAVWTGIQIAFNVATAGAGKVFSTLTSATKLQALWTGIVSGATAVWTGIQIAFNAVIAGAGKVFSTLTSATKLQALWTGIVSGATAVWTGIQIAFNAVIAGAGKVFSTLTSATKLQALWTGIVSGATAVWTGIQTAFNVVMAMNPVVLIVLAVIALVAAIVLVVSKTEGWGKAWKHTLNGAKLLFSAWVDTIKAHWNLVINGFMIGIDKMQLGWYKFKNAVGMGDKNANTAEINRLNADVEARKESIKAGYKKVQSTALAAAGEFKAAYDSVHWKKDGKEAKGTSGIAAPSVPGTDFGKGGGTGGGGGGSGAKAKKANEAVATGGTKHNYITINLKELIGIKADTITGGREASNKAGTEVADEILRVLAMAAAATG